MNTFYQLYACYTYGVYPKYTQMRITLCILNKYTSSITAFFHSAYSRAGMPNMNLFNDTNFPLVAKVQRHQL